MGNMIMRKRKKERYIERERREQEREIEGDTHPNRFSKVRTSE